MQKLLVSYISGNHLNPTVWDPSDTFVLNVQKLPVALQLKVTFDQLIACRFYREMYGDTNVMVSALIKDYEEQIKRYVTYKLCYRRELGLNDSTSATRQAICRILDGSDREFHSQETSDLIEGIYCITSEEQSEEVPSIDPTNKLWWKPFVLAGSTDQIEDLSEIRGPAVIEFSVEECEKNAASEHSPDTHNIMIRTSTPYFMSNCALRCQRLDQGSIKSFCMESYIANYMLLFDFRDIPVETIIGTIAEACQAFAPARPGLGATLRAIFMGVRTIAAGRVYNSPLSAMLDYNYSETLYKGIVELITILTDGCQAKLISPRLVADILNCLAVTEAQKTCASVVARQGGGASADELIVASEQLGSLEALRLFSQNPGLSPKQRRSGGLAAMEAAEGEDTGTGSESESKDSAATDSAADADKTGDQTSEPNSDDTEKDDTKDESATDDNPDDVNDEEDGEEAGNNLSEDTGAENDTSSEDTDSPENLDNVRSGNEPQVDTSEDPDYGFVFTVDDPDAETVDSVMFREELGSFLNDVLANPPADMPAECITILTNVKRYWLYTLGLKTVVTIVGSCVKLPESITNLIYKFYGETNE